ncbi:MAG: Ribonuclease HI [Anaerolineae bacterium]|nr:MAG: Ribonuclease HI [Anaerolineae bacterium]
MKTLYIVGYTNRNPGPAGLGVVVSEPQKPCQEIAVGYRISTDPRMHLRAFVEALKQLAPGEMARCVTCSEYVYFPVAEKRLSRWGEYYEWKIGEQPRPNRDLWEEAQVLLMEREVDMVFLKKVEGDRLLWRAHHLAKRAAAQPTLVDEGYESSEQYRRHLESEERSARDMEYLLARLSTKPGSAEGNGNP